MNVKTFKDVIDWTQKLHHRLGDSWSPSLRALKITPIQKHSIPGSMTTWGTNQYLESRAEIPEARDLLKQLLDMEEHETMHLAQQAARIGDL